MKPAIQRMKEYVDKNGPDYIYDAKKVILNSSNAEYSFVDYSMKLSVKQPIHYGKCSKMWVQHGRWLLREPQVRIPGDGKEDIPTDIYNGHEILDSSLHAHHQSNNEF